MRYAHMYTDPEGESHFGSIEIELSAAQYAPPAPPIYVSEAIGVTNAVIFSAPVGWFGDFHPSPRRQIYVGISGELEITASSGEARRFGPGSVLLLEDVDGVGHVTRVIGECEASGLFVHME